jgi:hypothetical protein
MPYYSMKRGFVVGKGMKTHLPSVSHTKGSGKIIELDGNAPQAVKEISAGEIKQSYEPFKLDNLRTILNDTQVKSGISSKNGRRKIRL